MVISLFLLIANKLPAVLVIKNIIVKIMVPVSMAVEYPAVKAGSIYSRSKTLLNTYTENIKLKEEIKSLKTKYMVFESLRNENTRLKKLLKFGNIYRGRVIPAEVLIKFPENYFSEFNINKGENDGLKEDMPVVTAVDSNWVLIGRIAEVFKDFSRVVLITSSDFRCAVNVSKIYSGVIKGNNSWLLKVKYLSPDAEISRGDEVYTSGMGGIFPPALYVGKVTGVETLEFSTGKYAVVKGAYYPQNAKYVYVVKNAKIKNQNAK